MRFKQNTRKELKKRLIIKKMGGNVKKGSIKIRKEKEILKREK